MDFTKQQYAVAYYYLHPYDFGVLYSGHPPLYPPLHLGHKYDLIRITYKAIGIIIRITYLRGSHTHGCLSDGIIHKRTPVI